ncbi:Uncharacterised protein [Mycobacterium tuberculosis]|nr:Uncharacterised protein [Mycobacterium tuberculosis]
MVEPSRTGFGTTIIKRHAEAAFQGQVQIDFFPHGLRWVMDAPRASFERLEAPVGITDVAV